MTDDSLDAFASAHLDRATSPEEVARFADDPALEARVADFQAVRDALRESSAIDPVRRDAAIAAAVRAFADEGHAEVTSLAQVAARRGPSPRSWRWLGAAAAVLLVALVPLLARLGSSHDDDTASSADEETATGGDAERPGDAAAPSVESTTTHLALLGLGDFADIDGLVSAVASAPRPLAGAEASDGGAEVADGAEGACLAQRSAVNASGAAQYSVAPATVAGEPVVVLVEGPVDDAQRVRVYRASDCTLLAERVVPTP